MSLAFGPVAGVTLAQELSKLIPILDQIPTWILWPALMLAASGAIVGFVAVFALFAVWLERKVSAHMQARLGPMEVGWHGALQTLADGIKLLIKEDVIPTAVDKPLFIIAPYLVFTGVLMTFVVLPFGPWLVVADLNIGLFYVAAVAAIEIIGVIMAGWASNNKWALFGTMRMATQLVSYEIPLGLSFLTVVVLAGSLSLNSIVFEQGGWFWNWYLFRNPFMPLAFLVYFIASLAEAKRAPFDLPEAESELVAGFHTEYSGMRFALFFLAEYAAMYVVAALGAVLFLGGWWWGVPVLDNLPGAAGAISAAACIVVKSVVLVFVQMWLRWTLPRIRLDQVMYLCLKVLLPFGFAALMGAVVWEMLWPGKVWFF